MLSNWSNSLKPIGFLKYLLGAILYFGLYFASSALKASIAFLNLDDVPINFNVPSPISSAAALKRSLRFIFSHSATIFLVSSPIPLVELQEASIPIVPRTQAVLNKIPVNFFILPPYLNLVF